MTDASSGPIFQDDLVELVDMFPTLADLAHLSAPPLCPEDSSKVLICTEGKSFAPLLSSESPGNTGTTKWKSAAFSQYPRPADKPQEDSDLPSLVNITIMGYSMRTADVRYTEWVSFNHSSFRPDWATVHGRELYMHANDTHGGENVNLAGQSQYATLVASLSHQLHNGWRDALPPSL